MCEKEGFLVFMLIIKIIVIVIIPIVLLIFRKNSYSRYLFIGEILLLVLFITLACFKNKCILNSNISGIKEAKMFNSIEYIHEPNDADTVENVVTKDFYKTVNNTDVYYFNNTTMPLSGKKLYCKNNSYMNNYGNLLTAVSTVVSTHIRSNISPINLLNLSYETGILDCDNGISKEDLFNAVSDKYVLSFINIDSSEVPININNNKVVLAEVEYKDGFSKNVTCSKGYIVIYSVDNSNNFKILNPDNRDYDYICPDNTIGSLSVLKANSNEVSYTLSELDNITTNYYVIERN